MRGLTLMICIALTCIVSESAGSAIPMWEFLSRNEKIGHLYQVFSKEVARYCAESTKPDCNKNLLLLGIRKLANSDDDFLDKLDPYQRGAKDLIWDSIMPNSRFGHELKDSLVTTDSDLAVSDRNENNRLGEESAPVADYVKPSDHTGPYLVGPMVIRVFPDGRPVPESPNHKLPKDEDIEDLKAAPVPSFDEIQNTSDNVLYQKLTALPRKYPKRVDSSYSHPVRRVQYSYDPFSDSRRFRPIYYHPNSRIFY